MATVDELHDRVGNMLGILPLGQALESQDKARITTQYLEVYADLKDDSLAAWAVAGAVPAKVTPWVVALVAWHLIPEYGVSVERERRITEKAAAAKDQIARRIQPAYETHKDPVDF